MINSASSKNRLAKNTLLLYGRTLLGMLISLYTSRVILQSLGIENYGIYNIVGGFAIISATLTSSTQRYLTVELGKSCNSNPQKVFSAAFLLHIILCITLLVLFETFGLWFLNTQLNINDKNS